MWNHGAGFFHSNNSVENHPICINSLFFSLLSNIFWYGCTTVHLTIHLMMDIKIVSSLGLLQITLLYKYVYIYIFLTEHRFSLSEG